MLIMCRFGDWLEGLFWRYLRALFFLFQLKLEIGALAQEYMQVLVLDIRAFYKQPTVYLINSVALITRARYRLVKNFQMSFSI